MKAITQEAYDKEVDRFMDSIELANEVMDQVEELWLGPEGSPSGDIAADDGLNSAYRIGFAHGFAVGGGLDEANQ